MHDLYLEWEVLEHPHTPKSVDWYWALGLVALATAVASFIFDNPLFGIFILLAAAALMLQSRKAPRLLRGQITKQGVVFSNRLYPYSSLRSFWIHEDRYPAKLVLTSEHTFVPHIHIPVADLDPAHVRGALLHHLDEVRHRYTLIEGLSEILEHHL